MLVAPLDANTLGKVASGICDNLLVSDSLGLPPSRGRAHWCGLQASSGQSSHLGIPVWWAGLLRTQSPGPPSAWCHLCSGRWPDGLGPDGWT